MRRTLTRDHEMHGKTMREGDEIIMLYPAANKDPRVWPDAHLFNIHRDFTRPALSFGFGKHYCLGAALARLEVRIMVEQILARMPNIALKPDAPGVKRPSCFIRGLVSLPVTY